MRLWQDASDKATEESRQAALYAIQQQNELRRQQEELLLQQEELHCQQEQQKKESNDREEELLCQQAQQKQEQEHMIYSFHQKQQIQVDALSTAVAKKPASRPDQKRLADNSAQCSVSNRSKRARQTVVSGGDDDNKSMFSDASQTMLPAVPDNIQVHTVQQTT
ncbi:unnamed protein product [Cylindrotheca closterium]|uniref:Uncharacterized protein n=1 Tax=Cylindrotheca closterium TaxID=2856 RepID=A0AAD2FL53_9STRA|nr:unnamed protein product [Cylindrotheca closterium]